MKTFLMISCKKATELTEKKLLGSISAMESLQLFMHRALCKACRRYGVQSREIDAFLKDHYNNFNPDEQADEADNEALKQKIKERIKNL
ncbi:hypothetical protein [Phaeodactylibacter xiamenensis]|uniref:hypothetical protein n=1 Tax=Phaeodactylibacter xiamenensis TaxID=1524460 RepID=UPI0024A7F388|nr:hypothetical protein [Phaeodactylibacter xiamenensis]